MTTTTIAASRLGDLLLARLLPPCKRASGPTRLRASLRRVSGRPLSASEWQALVDTLVADGLVETRPLRLTDAGRIRALELLGIDALPPRASWRTIQDRYLVPRALGVAPDDEATRQRIARHDGLAAFLLRQHHELPEHVALTPGSLMESLVCKELGHPEAASLKELCLRVLRDRFGEDAGRKPQKWVKEMSTRIVRANRASLDALRTAILARWAGEGVEGEEPAAETDLARPRAPSEEQPAAVGDRISFDPPAFAATVLEVARGCPDGWLGDDRVLISHVWRQLRQEPSLAGLELAPFKQYLLEAKHAGLIELRHAGAGQVGGADREHSEIRDPDGSTFHVVRVERSRSEALASASPQGQGAEGPTS
jgi:hypothetical protein